MTSCSMVGVELIGRMAGFPAVISIPSINISGRRYLSVQNLWIFMVILTDRSISISSNSPSKPLNLRQLFTMFHFNILNMAQLCIHATVLVNRWFGASADFGLHARCTEWQVLDSLMVMYPDRSIRQQNVLQQEIIYCYRATGRYDKPMINGCSKQLIFYRISTFLSECKLGFSPKTTHGWTNLFT